MADVATLPIAGENQIETNGLVEEIMEEVEAKQKISEAESSPAIKGDDIVTTPVEIEMPVEAAKAEPHAEEEQKDEDVAEPSAKPEEPEAETKGDTINSNSSSAKDCAITESSEVNQKVTEKDSAGSKSRKSLVYRFRSWFTSMFATKGEQPSSINKVVGNLRNSLRRKNNGTPKKDKKGCGDAGAPEKSQEISEEMAAPPSKPTQETTGETDSNIDEAVATATQQETVVIEKPVEQVETVPVLEDKTTTKSDDKIAEDSVTKDSVEEKTEAEPAAKNIDEKTVEEAPEESKQESVEA